MSTQFTNRQWRLPNNENKDKQSNYSMSFTSTSDYIDVGQPSELGYGTATTAFTISVWAKTGDWNNKYLFSNRGSGTGTNDSGFAFSTTAAYSDYNGLLLRVGNNTNIAAAFDYNELQTNTWTHFVIVYNGSGSANSDKVKIYKDSTSLSLTFNLGNIPSTITSTLDFAIGAYTWQTGRQGAWDGQIDAVSIFNYALSDGTGGTVNQIAALYGSSSTGIGNPMAISGGGKPVAYYPLGDQDAFNGADYLTPNASLKDFVFDFIPNDYIDCGNDSSLNISGDLTISAWVKINNYDSYNAVISKIDSSTRNYEILIRPSIPTGGISFYVANSSFITSTGTIPLNTWTHIIVTVESGVTNGAKIYINGSQDATTGTLTINSNTANLNIGRRTTGSFYIDGKISNTQIFNTALPATGSNSVETLYNNGSPLTSMSGFSSLQGWWKLDASATYDSSTTTWTIPDDSSNSNDGTSSGMTQSALQQSDLSFKTSISPYALSFSGSGDYIDLNSDITLTGNKSVSFWVNFTSTIAGVVFGGASSNYYPYIDATSIYIRAGGALSTFAHGGLTAGVWYNICITGDGTNATAYLNGSSLGTQTDKGFTFKLINAEGAGYYGVDGKLSNCAIWNAALTSSQVKEIYNQGLPSNLHNFSGTAPVAWWQLGENSSFNGNDWICADEIGSNNGESDGMPVGALTNGVGTTANGTSTGMSEGSLVGDAPYSTANAISSGMPVTARGTDVPPTILNNTYSLNFDGTNESLLFIDANGSYTFNEFAGANGTQSYSFWIKPDIDGSNDYIISGNHVQYGGLYFVNGLLRYYARYQGDFATDLALTNNVWQHVALVFDLNGLVQPYKNGQPTTALTNIPMPYKSYFDRIGMLERRYHPMKGNLDEFSAYNYALSANQVQSIYSGVFETPNNVLSLNPILYYRFEEGTGTTINDSSTAGLNAYKSNGVTFQTEAP